MYIEGAIMSKSRNIALMIVSLGLGEVVIANPNTKIVTITNNACR